MAESVSRLGDRLSPKTPFGLRLLPWQNLFDRRIPADRRGRPGYRLSRNSQYGEKRHRCAAQAQKPKLSDHRAALTRWNSPIWLAWRAARFDQGSSRQRLTSASSIESATHNLM